MKATSTSCAYDERIFKGSGANIFFFGLRSMKTLKTRFGIIVTVYLKDWSAGRGFNPSVNAGRVGGDYSISRTLLSGSR